MTKYLMNLIILSIVILLVGAYCGYSYEHRRFAEYKKTVEQLGEQAEQKNRQLESDSQQKTQQVTTAYETKISKLHTYYRNLTDSAVRVRIDTSSGSVSTVPTATTTVDAAVTNALPVTGSPDNTNDPRFVEQCALTTQQLDSLQLWITEQQRIFERK